MDIENFEIFNVKVRLIVTYTDNINHKVQNKRVKVIIRPTKTAIGVKKTAEFVKEHCQKFYENIQKAKIIICGDSAGWIKEVADYLGAQFVLDKFHLIRTLYLGIMAGNKEKYLNEYNHCKYLTDFSPHVLVEETMKLNEFNNAFQTEQDCLKYIASLKKNKCIMCSWTSLNTSNLRRIRCLKCHQTFSILHGTIFYKSQTPLRFWFYLIFRWINTKHGITSTDVAKELGVTLKTAWRMGHEIRNRIAKQEHQFIVEAIVQMDEMYLSHMGFKKQGRSLINKTLIVGIYEKTTNNLIVKVIKNAKSKNLLQFARNHISSKCDVHTDSWKGYRDFKSLFPNHKTVNHQDGYVSKIGVNTNQIESVWKHIRRTFKTHIKVAKHHVHLYAKEAAYKFNKIPTFETVMLCFI
ncbi:IS1595 family transposase [Spiroplasma ixodetis]|uniref:IS1595 family transposase n=3 Tax=Spiroplasma ixodetis TaxID=2141 RepID=UPI002574EDE2|nr:IS1595 family transposase [Spiroplasma ixodetis]